MSEVVEVVQEITTKDVKRFRGIIIFFGILNIILGIMAMGAPFVVGTMVTVIIGVVLIVSGISELIHIFSSSSWKRGIFDFVGGALAIIGGGLIISSPLLGMAMLSMLLIFYFIMDGIFRISISLKIKPVPGWGMMLAGGLASLILGIMIWRGWPLSGLVAIGVLVGIRIMFAGWSMIFIGSAVGSALKAESV
jgi:uncharacterized membrane protein HdeD (DUF308 family)